MVINGSAEHRKWLMVSNTNLALTNKLSPFLGGSCWVSPYTERLPSFPAAAYLIKMMIVIMINVVNPLYTDDT